MSLIHRNHRVRQMFEFIDANEDAAMKSVADTPPTAIFTIDENEDSMPTNDSLPHVDLVFQYDGNGDIMVRE